jgi:hypothetical protein
MAIFASIRHKSIRASAVHRKMDLSATSVNWRNLFLFDVHANAERTIFPLSDEFGFFDAPAFLFGKVVADQFGMHSNPPVFDFTKTSSDQTTLTDALTTEVVKSATDATLLSDAATFSSIKVSQSDFALSDQPVMTRQPYNFTFTEVSGVVTVTGEPTDSFGFSDSITGFTVNAVLQDYYTLDDFSQVDKDVTGVKTNIVGMTDVIELDHMITSALLNKALVGNMLLNA